jgi:hypothetical protein
MFSAIIFGVPAIFFFSLFHLFLDAVRENAEEENVIFGFKNSTGSQVDNHKAEYYSEMGKSLCTFQFWSVILDMYLLY